jgi:hypothetical protein
MVSVKRRKYVFCCTLLLGIAFLISAGDSALAQGKTQKLSKNLVQRAENMVSSQFGYLELDMSDAAMTALAEKAQETNTRADQLFSAIHELTKTTKVYINSLK